MAEQLGEPRKGIVPGFLVHMGVDLHRGRDMGMPEDHLSVAGRDVQLLQERRSCVPKVMDLDRPELVVVADPAEPGHQVPGLARSPAARAEPMPVSYHPPPT